MRLRILGICAALPFPAVAHAELANVKHPVDDTGDAGAESDNDEQDAEATLPKHASFYDLTRKHPVALEAQIAPFGSPTGWLGAGVDLSLVPAVAFYAGAGAGRRGAQWAVGVRPRVSVGQNSAFTATLAFSRGNFTPLDQ